MKRKCFILLLVIAMFCNFVMPFNTFATESVNYSFEYSHFTVNYNIINSWDDNQNIEVKITNTGDEPIRNWAIQYNSCGVITGLWGGELLNESIIKNAYYNSDIDVGTSVTFGYTLTNVIGTPNEFALCSYREEKTDGFVVDFSVQNSWDTGFSGLVTITNTTDVPIMAWELSFNSNFSIIQTENCKIIEENNNNYKICGTYNGNIPALSSITIELTGSFVETPEILNKYFTEIVIKSTYMPSEQPNENIYFKDIQNDDEVAYDSENGVFFVRNQILLTASNNASFTDIYSLVGLYDAQIVGYINLTNDYQIEFNNDVTVDYLYQAINELRLNQFIEFASLNTAFVLSAEDNIINDPESLVDLDKESTTNNNWNIYAINAHKAWKNYYDKMDIVKIGLIDTTFDKGHDDLKFTQIWENLNLENCIDAKEQSHGTRVAGIMAAKYDNGIGITGICPKNDLYAYSYCGGLATFKSIMSYKYGLALLVANNVRVINCSMCYERGIAYAATINANVPTSKNKTVRSSISENSKILDNFLTKLINNGYDFVIIVAAGNDNNRFYIADPSCTQTYGYREAKLNEQNSLTSFSTIDAKYSSIFAGIPLSSKAYDRIIVVGAIKNSNPFTLASFSNIGARVDVVAPGNGVTTTDIYNNYYNGSGTSFAAPHVSGVAGMMYSVNSNITADQVKAEIIASGSNNLINGYPLVDANKAVAKALGYSNNSGYDEKTNGILMGKIYEKGTGNSLSDVSVSINGGVDEHLDINEQQFEIFLPAGINEVTFSKTDYEPLTIKILT